MHLNTLKIRYNVLNFLFSWFRHYWKCDVICRKVAN